MAGNRRAGRCHEKCRPSECPLGHVFLLGQPFRDLRQWPSAYVVFPLSISTAGQRVRSSSRSYRDGMKENKKQQLIDPASLAPKATAGGFTLHARTVGTLPIINRCMERWRLRETLDTFLPVEDGRNRVSTAALVCRNARLGSVRVMVRPFWWVEKRRRQGPTAMRYAFHGEAVAGCRNRLLFLGGHIWRSCLDVWVEWAAGASGQEFCEAIVVA